MSSDEDVFPQHFERQLQNYGNHEHLENVIRKQEHDEERGIRKANCRSYLRWGIYFALFISSIILLPPPSRLWIIVRDDASELFMILSQYILQRLHGGGGGGGSNHLVLYPLRRHPLEAPINHRWPKDHDDYELVLTSLQYWMGPNAYNGTKCLCAHHLVTDLPDIRLCLVRSMSKHVVLWNMRITGGIDRSFDDDDDSENPVTVTRDEQSQFCQSVKRAVSRRHLIYVTWQDLKDASYHFNEFFGDTARCLQIADQEMNADYECA